MGYYKCCLCEKEFHAKHNTAVCPECKATPSVCVICGKEFKKSFPYTQKTCSVICRGKYRAESGIAKAGAAKMKQTKLDRYGSVDPNVVSIAKNGELTKRICPLCNKEFQPKAVRQVYCEDKHYAPCPVCGKMTEIKDYNIGVQACSDACRVARIQATCLEKYGNINVLNSEYGRELARETSLNKYGVEYYTQTDEYKQRYKQTLQEKYGVSASIQVPEFREKAIKTNLERYGSEWAMQSEEIKEKSRKTQEEKYGGAGLASPELRARIIATNLERYGVEFPFQDSELQDRIHQESLEKNGTIWPATAGEVNERRDATNIRKYGCKNVWGNKDIQRKIRELWTEKYGGPNPMCDPNLVKLAQERHDKTMLEKYGSKYTMNVPELKQKVSDTIQERYGVPWFCMTQECSEHNYSIVSKQNQKFADCLEELGIKTRFEHYIGRHSFDIHLTDQNTFIEVDPTYTHNGFGNHWGDGIPKDYHVNKTQVAEKAGFRCIHVFDWDSWERIIQLVIPKDAVYARNCKVLQIDKNTAEIFTSSNHIQGSCRGQVVNYGLYHDGELVQVMTFGQPRYNKNYDFELLRLCSRSDSNVIGGASKLFSQFKRDYPGKSVISYCDYAKFSGSVYEQLGMKLLRLTPPAKVWSKGHDYYTDNFLRQRGYDQIFHTNYGKGSSNEELMLENGWLPVYDCGQKVFIYNPEESGALGNES